MATKVDLTDGQIAQNYVTDVVINKEQPDALMLVDTAILYAALKRWKMVPKAIRGNRARLVYLTGKELIRRGELPINILPRPGPHPGTPANKKKFKPEQNMLWWHWRRAADVIEDTATHLK